MITLIDYNGRLVVINPAHIISIAEGSTTQRARGIQSVVRTTDKEVHEVREAIGDVVAQITTS